MPLSGIEWVRQFPTSNKVRDLSPAFQAKVIKFLDALVTAGADVTVTATKRPRQRAYLMHYEWCIANGRIDPAHVPQYAPSHTVDIQWLHRNVAGQAELGKSRDAALQIVHAYGIGRLGVPPALKSLHIDGNAIDMILSWKGVLTIKDALGKTVAIDTHPRDGTNAQLIRIGATFGVNHLISYQKDPPHWSTTGH